MPRILAIDPGSSFTGWLLYDSGADAIRAHDRSPNPDVLDQLRDHDLSPEVDVVVIEWTAPRGMPASAELFETLWWAGRFTEAARPVPVERLNRLTIKRLLCGTSAAKDVNVRSALIDRFGGAGGKAAAIGLKASPGPLYAVKADVWAALAVAVVFGDHPEEVMADPATF